MKSILLLFTALFTVLTGFAQQTRSQVQGTVVDENAKVMEMATITLQRTVDSTVARVSAADRNGRFLFDNVKPGQYFVSVTAAGHQKAFSASFAVDASGNGFSVPPIKLLPASKNMGGVTVTARKPLIEQKIDRTIVNVEAAVTNVGATALEVLEKSPGVSVDKDGNISLKGKQGVQVYVDGRPTYLAGNDLANFLRNLGSGQLDQIEIMTNPPAKYDAAGNSGIINIRTKKTKQVGYNGSLSSTWSQGRYPKVNEAFTFNYRKNKVNLFSNLGYSNRRNFQDLHIQRRFLESSTKEVISHFDQVSRIREHSQSFNGKIGLDYYLSKKTTLGAVVNGFYNPGTFGNRSDVLISDPSYTLLSRTLAAANNDRKWRNLGANINFRHQFDSTGRELTADVDYVQYRSTNRQDLVNAYFNPAGQPLMKADTLLGDLPQDIDIYTARVDYTHPLAKGAKLEAGLKTSFVRTDNNAVYDSINYGQRVRDIGRSNHFLYEENINAAYVNYSRPLGKKWFSQLGLRVENTNAKGRQLTTGEEFNRRYTQLFPTAFLQFKANAKNTFGLNYGRRIERPDYEDLNPFILFLDRYTFQQGNPNLQPQFAHNLELSHTWKGFLTTTLNYTRTTDIINDVLEQDPVRNETMIRKQNIARQRQYGIAVSAGGAITKWWSGNAYVNVFNNLFEGVVNGDPVKLDATALQLNVSNQFRFAKTWSAELGGFYTTGGVDGVFRIGDFGVLNMGISKQVLKGKGTLRLNFRDLLYTQKINGQIRYSNIDASFQQVRDSRQVALGFTWRFSKGKVNGTKRRTGAAAEEQNRVKTGGDN